MNVPIWNVIIIIILDFRIPHRLMQKVQVPPQTDFTDLVFSLTLILNARPSSALYTSCARKSLFLLPRPSHSPKTSPVDGRRQRAPLPSNPHLRAVTLHRSHLLSFSALHESLLSEHQVYLGKMRNLIATLSAAARHAR